jgi:hypothetical protein
MPETLGKRLLGAGIDETKVVEPGDGEDPAHLTRGTADEESSALARQLLVSEEDRRDPGGVNEVATLEADKDVGIVGNEPPLELVGDG